MGIKLVIKKLINYSASAFVYIFRRGKLGTFFFDFMAHNIMNSSVYVSHGEKKFQFCTPNRLCMWRAKTFSSKEPETLGWIENMPKDSILWDVGANIGLYSIYAAKVRNCQVYAFEPSVFNLEVLARNIVLNSVNNLVNIIPLALSDQSAINRLRMTTTVLGGALSSFDHDLGWDGKSVNSVFEYQTFGIKMDELVEKMNLPNPDYIKMDVDGIEHFILTGGVKVLNKVKGVLIEVNEDFLDQASQVKDKLERGGLKLVEKKHSELISSSEHGFQNTFNQIWVR